MPDFNKNDFQGNPVSLDVARSKFAMPFKHKTTFKAGKLIPIFSYGDVLPGDTFKIDMSCLVRMTTPVFPTLDDAYLDVYFFFTPHKLTLSRAMMSPSVNDSNHSWAAFIGAQDSLLNMPTPSTVKLPFVRTNGHTVSGGDITTQLGSLADYLGLGLSKAAHGISCLEPLAYYSIWNNYFRDENTMNPVCYTISGALTESNPDLDGRSAIYFSGFDGTPYRWGPTAGPACIGNEGSILPVCRPHGYFGSALPWPQRNSTTVNLPLSGFAPVVDGYDNSGLDAAHAYRLNAAAFAGNVGAGQSLTVNSGGSDHGRIESGSTGTDLQGLYMDNPAGYIQGGALRANLAGASGISVNQLRLMVQTQRFYEALARGGNRIGEMTASMFGVTPSDLASDRPEYLGGKRIRISMDQVANTAGASAGSAGQTLGSLGAYSNTGDASHYFEKSFDTWGTLTCVVCVRTNESFDQGIQRRYSRKERLDFYWPVFANLGEQSILKKELWFDSTQYTLQENAVFGYQEAWAEYRYLPDIVSGHLRPQQSLGSYTYCNDFLTFPSLAGYLDGTSVSTNIDRTLVVPGSTAGFQFIGDFSFNIVATRPMPRYSIPGLVDHH